MIQIHLFKDAVSDYDDETANCDAGIGRSSMVATAGTRTIVDTNDIITSMALLRDKTLLQTDTVAWNYTWAYDAAYLQFYEHEAQVAASEKGHDQQQQQQQACKGGHSVRPGPTAKHQAVDSALQRTLIHGILLDYGTLERFSGDSAIRRKQARQTRRFILQMYHALKDGNSADCPDERLATYCQAINRMPEQWAVFMGHVQAAAVAAEAALCMDDDDVVVPARALPSLPSSRLPLPAWAEAAEENVLDSGRPQRTKYSFRCWHERRRMSSAKPINITLSA
jgi:hypothetical protein